MKFISDNDLKIQLREATVTDKAVCKSFYFKVDGGYLEAHKVELTLSILQGAKLYVEDVQDDTKIIVTRHDVLEEFFRKEMGINAKRVNFARPYEIKGKDVYGTLPLALMGEANSLTTVHGKCRDGEDIDNMTLEEFKRQITDVRRYTVNYVKVWGEVYDV